MENVVTFKKVQKTLSQDGIPFDWNSARTIVNMLGPQSIGNTKAITDDRYERFIQHVNAFLEGEGVPLLEIADTEDVGE